jgi:hypothetical protein
VAQVAVLEVLAVILHQEFAVIFQTTALTSALADQGFPATASLVVEQSPQAAAPVMPPPARAVLESRYSVHVPAFALLHVLEPTTQVKSLSPLQTYRLHGPVPH